jgi:PilZ domain-containing protein
VKRLVDLTIEDLTATPVWRYEGGSGVEAVVVPETRDGLSQADEEVFLAATEFALPDATQHLGFCFPVDDSGIDYLQPVIVTRSGQVRFWFDGPITQEVLAAQWNALEKPVEEIFPVRFRCLVPVDGRTVTGAIANVESSGDLSRDLEAEPIPMFSKAATASPHGPRSTGVTVLEDRPTKTPRPFSARPFRKTQQRAVPRHDVEMMVEFEQGESHGTGVTGNVSRDGMFVRASRLPNTGPLLNLTVHLPGGRKLLLKGRVVRTAALGLPRPASSSGFGLRLTDKSDEFEEFLSLFPDTTK